MLVDGSAGPYVPVQPRTLQWVVCVTPVNVTDAWKLLWYILSNVANSSLNWFLIFIRGNHLQISILKPVIFVNKYGDNVGPTQVDVAHSDKDLQCCQCVDPLSAGQISFTWLKRLPYSPLVRESQSASNTNRWCFLCYQPTHDAERTVEWFLTSLLCIIHTFILFAAFHK